MSEELQVAVDPVESAPVEEAAAPPVEETPAWVKALDEAPADELRKHKKFWGIVGSELETRREAWEISERTRLQKEADSLFETQMTDAMTRMLEDDPEEFESRYPALKTYIEARPKIKQEQEIAALRSETREQFARRIGQTFNRMPEWRELTTADKEDIYAALAGKSDDEAVEVFTEVASAKIAAVRARKETDSWRTSTLEKEREAIRLEERAALLQNGARPDIGRVRGTGTISDEPNWRTDPQGWEAWYGRQNAAARRS